MKITDSSKLKIFMKKQARELFPNISKNEWTFIITEWETNNCQIKYQHNYIGDSIMNRIEFIDIESNIYKKRVISCSVNHNTIKVWDLNFNVVK